MNKKLIPVVIVLLLLAVGYYWFKMRPSNSLIGAPQSVQQAQSEAAEWAKAIQSGKPTICTMTKGADKMEYAIKGKKMRANMSTTVAVGSATPQLTVSHMINDEAYFYMWQDGQKQGTKMSVNLPSPSPYGSIAPAPREPSAPKFDSEADYDNLKNEGYTINCQSGNVSDADFVPPEGVNFIDPTQMMQQVAPQGVGGQIDMQKLEELQKQYGGATPSDY